MCASARSRPFARSRLRRDAHGPRLRTAGHGTLQYSGDGTRLLRPLQHARGGESTGGRPHGSPQGVLLMMDTELAALYQDVIIDHNKSPRNFRELEPPRK